MFGRLKKKQTKLQPEARWTAAVTENSIRITDHAGVTKEIRKSDLSGVIIETNDTGPWGADVWWLLFGRDDQVACAFPQGTTGEADVIEFLTALPTFDLDEMIKAMRSTDNAVFPVWRRPLS